MPLVVRTWVMFVEGKEFVGEEVNRLNGGF